MTDRAFFARNLRPAFVATEDGQRILDWVEYRDRIWAAGGGGEPVERQELDPALIDVLQAEMDLTSSLADSVLRKVNPRSIAELRLFQDLLHDSPWGQDLAAEGLGQSVWAVGAGGAGTAALDGYLTRYLRCYAQWRATHLLADNLKVASPDNFVTVILGSLGQRLLRTRCNFWWATRELALLIARHTPPHILPEDAVTELAEYVDIYAQTTLWANGLGDRIPLSPAAQDVARRCSVTRGSLVDKPFRDMMVMRDAELYPFIDAEGVLVPAALQYILDGFHVSLFHTVSTQYADTVDCGGLWELVCRDALSNLFTPSTRLLPDRMNIYSDSGAQISETDFAIAHNSVLLLGEVKSKAAPGQVVKYSERFNSQITETFEKLDKRVRALTSEGATLRANGAVVDTSDISTFIGIGVVFHDYGGAIWDAKILRQAQKGKPGFAILRAIDLVMLAHTLRDMTEFLDYVAFRQEFMDCNGVAVDEIDIVAAYLENSRGYRHMFRNANKGSNDVNRVYAREVPRELLNSPHPPEKIGPWRATVANFAKIIPS
ncbi:hypothetical protein [Mycobacteroides chelonae]|uniref:hypothetical protein n=1 Tax=Mycobacteroides chelonae TaxID=1774 RepID=UPI001041EE92|nr:hypothetical protein [Mycobacteroides chelonae]